MKIGIIGFPQSGKTTLFNLLTGASVDITRHPGGRGALHVGVVRVPDERVDVLSSLFKPKKTTFATVDVVDVAGFAKGERASLDLVELKGADALLHVVRAFENLAIPHPEGSVDPVRDVEGLELELILADLEVVERRVDRLEATLKRKHTDQDKAEYVLLGRIKPGLESEVPIREMECSQDEIKLLRGFGFLSQKPILHLVNLGERDLTRGQEILGTLRGGTRRTRREFAWASLALEQEIAQLSDEEQQAFLSDAGLKEPTPHRVLRDCYRLLGLISFLTTVEDEVRAWSVAAGTPAQRAAGVIHSDMERGFIRAEVIRYEELVGLHGSLTEAREKGLLRLEGKEYVIEDGDVVHFRFHVGR